MHSGAVVLVVLPLAFVCPATAGLSITYHVNSTADAPDANTADGICQTSTSGECTLRAAVQQANATGGVITIEVPAISISISERIGISKSLQIRGAGMAATRISGESQDLIFGIVGNIQVTLADMALVAGKQVLSGGAISMISGAFVTLDRCLLADNEADSGGGVFCLSAALTIQDSVLASNHATGASGVGGAVSTGTCQLTVSGTTFSDNTSVSHGGAVDLSSASTARMANSTISRNTAGGDGGAIHLSSTSSLALYSTTIASNRGKHSTGGIFIAAGGSASLQNSIVASNLSGADGGFLLFTDCSGNMTSYGGVIVSSLTGCAVTGSFAHVNPLLGPLQDNGGGTPTNALLAGSPAIDAGVGGCFGGYEFLTTDQRGADRTVGAACDIGPYERAPCGDANGDGDVNVGDVLFLVNTLFAGGGLPTGLADVNDDENVNVSDVLFLVNHLFAGGPAPSCPGT